MLYLRLVKDRRCWR